MDVVAVDVATGEDVVEVAGVVAVADEGAVLDGLGPLDEEAVAVVEPVPWWECLCPRESDALTGRPGRVVAPAAVTLADAAMPGAAPAGNQTAPSTLAASAPVTASATAVALRRFVR